MTSKLAEDLHLVRQMRGYSLREVEKKTGISNTYLSQLETGKAEKPSPHILYTLANYYEIPYESLMKAAGYLQPKTTSERKEKHLSGLQAALYSANLEEGEEKKVAEFIAFLRSQRRRKEK